MKGLPALLLLLALCAASARAHEVHHRIEATQAVVVTLTYANGEPFAFEKYALYPDGQATPQQVGNTDAHGRIVFIPGSTGHWRVQATSADGHGLNQSLSVPTTPSGHTGQSSPSASETTPRWLLAGFGLALIFGLFGVYQLFSRRPR